MLPPRSPSLQARSNLVTSQVDGVTTSPYGSIIWIAQYQKLYPESGHGSNQPSGRDSSFPPLAPIPDEGLNLHDAERQAEGIKRAFEGGGPEFDEEVSGRTLFVLTRLQTGSARRASDCDVETKPPPNEAQ